MKFLPTACAEFPNDNSQLHDGATWVCPWSRAQPRAVVQAAGLARVMTARCAESEGDPVAEEAPAHDPPAMHAATPLPGPVDSNTHDSDNADSNIQDSTIPSELPPPTRQLPPVASASFRAVDTEPTELSDLAHPPPLGWVFDATPEDPPALLSDEELFGAEPATPLAGAVRPRPASEPLVPRSDNEHDAEVSGPAAAAGFVVPRPGDLMDTPTSEGAVSESHASELSVSELQPSQLLAADDLAAQLHGTALSDVASASADPRTADGSERSKNDDPFVRDLRDLVLGVERTDATGSSTLPPLELELTPAVPSAASPGSTWTGLLGLLAKCLLKRGATRAAALLPETLSGRHVGLGDLDASVRVALIACGFAEARNGQCYTSAKFRSDAVAYRVQFDEQTIEVESFRSWLGVFLQALLPGQDLDEILEDLDRAGLPQAVNAA